MRLSQVSAAIGREVGSGRHVVDSAATTARATAAELEARGLLRDAHAGEVRLLATDSPERFARVGQRFLGAAIAPGAIETVDL